MAAGECWICRQKIQYQKEKKEQAYNEAKLIANEQGETMVIYKEGTIWKYCKSGNQPLEATDVNIVSKYL